MKKIGLLLLLATMIFSCRKPKSTNSSPIYFSRDTSIVFHSLRDTDSILNVCFSPLRIVKKIAIWKPTLDDIFNLPVSDDGLIHSRIDTIIKLNVDSYLILFRTDDFQNSGKIADCHVCSPVYSIASIKHQNNQYTITNFKKDFIAAGSFGHGYDTLRIENFGKDYRLLKIASGYTGTSTNTMTDTFFELSEYTQVFQYNCYRSVGDSTEDYRDYEETELNLQQLPGRNNIDKNDIELKGTKTYFDAKSRSIKKKKVTEFYRADDFGNYQRAFN